MAGCTACYSRGDSLLYSMCTFPVMNSVGISTNLFKPSIHRRDSGMVECFTSKNLFKMNIAVV